MTAISFPARQLDGASMAKAGPLRRLLVLAAVLLSFAGALDAAAQPEPTPSAAQRIAEARRLQAQGKHAEACEALRSAEVAKPDGSTTLLLAKCQQRAGQPVEAYRTYARLEREPGSSAALKLAAKAGKATLEKTIARLTIRPPATPQGTRIELDGRDATSELGAEVPHAPGRAQLAATAPGHQRWTTEVELAAGDARTIEVPALERDVIDPVATNDAIVKRDQAGGATWDPAVGFRSPPDGAAPSAPPAANVAAPLVAPALRHERLHRFQMYGGVGWQQYRGGEDGMHLDIIVQYEHKKRFSHVSVWGDADFPRASPPFAGGALLGTGLRVGVDWRPGGLSEHLAWIGVGPFVGGHFVVDFEDGADGGPDLGFAHLTVHTGEHEHLFPIVRVDGWLFERFGTEASATFLQGRFTVGDGFRVGAQGLVRFGESGEAPDPSVYAHQPEAQALFLLGGGT